VQRRDQLGVQTLGHLIVPHLDRDAGGREIRAKQTGQPLVPNQDPVWAPRLELILERIAGPSHGLDKRISLEGIADGGCVTNPPVIGGDDRRVHQIGFANDIVDEGAGPHRYLPGLVEPGQSQQVPGDKPISNFAWASRRISSPSFSAKAS
jgi:hypothetical protein